jgi:hypothetical protein
MLLKKQVQKRQTLMGRITCAARSREFDQRVNGIHVGQFLTAVCRFALDDLRPPAMSIWTCTWRQVGYARRLTFLAETGDLRTCRLRQSTICAISGIRVHGDERLFPWRGSRESLLDWARRLLVVADVLPIWVAPHPIPISCGACKLPWDRKGGAA